jgi:hypothetical protein
MKQQLFQASDNLALVTDWAHNHLRQQGIYESCKIVLLPRRVRISCTLAIAISISPSRYCHLRVQQVLGVLIQTIFTLISAR